MNGMDAITQALEKSGPISAADLLISQLRQTENYPALFYARLLKARLQLGVSPFPTGPAADLPEHVHESYEQAIREAAREVGGLLLAKNDIPRAWAYFRLIGESQPVKDALENWQPNAEDDIYPLVDVAWHQRVHPTRGFDLILDRNGICSAITTLNTTDLTGDPALRLNCIRKLVTALHKQLRDRLIANLAPDTATGSASIRDVLTKTDAHADAYLIDVSHLSSVVQMTLDLPPGDPVLPLSRDLCAYGRTLPPELRGRGDPPFEDTYDDYARVLGLLAGDDVDETLQHFERKASLAAAQHDTFPAEVLVNLFVRLDRLPDALAVARRFLSDAEDTSLTCPSVMELARRTGDFEAMARLAQSKGDAVTFLAAAIAGSQVPTRGSGG